MGKRKPITFTLDEDDMARLTEVGANLKINRSRAVSLAINLLNRLMTMQCREPEPKPLTYEEAVLPAPREQYEQVSVESALQPELGRAKRKGGWPKGRLRGSRKSKPVLTVIEGKRQERSALR